MRKPISITIDEKLVEELRLIAIAENRSLSNVIETFIREALSSK